MGQGHIWMVTRGPGGWLEQSLSLVIVADCRAAPAATAATAAAAGWRGAGIVPLAARGQQQGSQQW